MKLSFHSNHSKAIWVLIVFSFVLWAFSFRNYFFNKSPLVADAISYYEHIDFYIENIRRGIYPMWESTRQGGVPAEFFMRRIGAPNPFFFLIIPLEAFFDCFVDRAANNSADIPYTYGYLWFLAIYFFIGMIGFYLLARRIFRDTYAAITAFLLLLFSSLGTLLFFNYIILLFVPFVWFFYFLMAFFEKQEKQNFLGLTFCSMLIISTYIPFYFLTIFLSFLIVFALVYFRYLKEFILRCFQFLKSNKIFVCCCLVAFILSLLPGVLFYLDGGKGDFVLAGRQAADFIGKVGLLDMNVLEVSTRRVTEPGIITKLQFEKIFPDLHKANLEMLYVPLFALLIFVFGLGLSVNRRLIFFALLGFGTFLISSTEAPFFAFLHKHVFFFRYFRNLTNFLWLLMLPVTILFLVEQFRLLIHYRPQTKKAKYGCLAVLIFLHVLVAFMVYAQKNAIVTTYGVLFLSCLYFMYYVWSGKKGVFFFIFPLFILIVMQPLQVFHYYQDNATKIDRQNFRYGPYLMPYLENPFESKEYLFSVEEKIKNLKIDPLEPKIKKTFPIYFGMRWWDSLHRDFNSKSIEALKRAKLRVYDRVEVVNEKQLDHKRIERAFEQYENVAFVFDDHQEHYLNKDVAPVDPHPQFLSDEALVSYGVNFIKFETDFDTRKFLVYNDVYHRGWNAFVNGEKTSIWRANIAFKGVWVPAGKNVVHLRFGSIWRHTLNYVNIFVSLGVCLALFFLAGKSYVMRKKSAALVEEESEDVLLESEGVAGKIGSSKWRNNKVIRAVACIGKRVVILYVVMFLIAYAVFDKKKVKAQNKVKELNEFYVNPDYLAYVFKNQKNFDKEELKKQVKYYEKINQYMPSRSAAYGLLGFCHYHLGNYDKAIDYYNKAIYLNPDFFWFWYNLGVVYFKNDQYQEAAVSLGKAVTSDVGKTSQFVQESKVYRPILSAQRITDREQLKNQLKEGYRDCYKMLILSQLQLKNYAEVVRIAEYATSSGFSEEDFFYYYLGITAFKLKQFKKAVFYFQECLNKNSHHAEAYYHLGLSLKALGHEKQSVIFLERATHVHKINGPTPSVKEEIRLNIY